MAIEALFRLILVQLHRGLARRTATARAMPDRRFDLVRRFEALVDRDPAANRPVGDYAAALNVTPTHLARMVRAVTGRAPGDILHDRLVLAARRQRSEEHTSELPSTMRISYSVFGLKK